ncbi:MAG TPA: choice-of-anchor Q domain-containing protein [Pyrinomonadaceae bacterium]|nr:choice-of-anchor Q domain-containing protein [Pyrinomonadaceae bacterium]
MDQVRTQSRKRVLLVGAILASMGLQALILPYPTMPVVKAAATIVVNTTNQEVNNDADCSLQEAIFAANFDTNKAIDPANLNGPLITTGCTAGSGDDTIVLQTGAVYLVSGIAQDQFNVPGLDANPRIFTTITIEGNGARLERIGSLNIRAFTVNSGQQEIDPGPPTVISGTGNLTIRNLHIKGFKAKGGNGADGGGGGLGAGGAIYVNAGAASLGPPPAPAAELTVENCTFEGNTATGGDGSGAVGAFPEGGGGGLGGNGGAGDPGTGAGGGGGGSRGNGETGGTGGGGGGGGTANNGVSGGATLGGNGGFNCGGKGGDSPSSPGANGFCAGGGGGGGALGDAGSTAGGNGGSGNYGGGGGGGGNAFPGGVVFGNGGPGGFGGGGGTGTNGGNGGFGGGGGAKASAGGVAGGGGSFAGSGDFFAGGGGAGLGGAIFSDQGNVTILNSTFVGNSAAGGISGGGGSQAGSSRGGAVFVTSAGVVVSNSTFSANASGTGGGLFLNNSNLILRNTILANNGTGECDTNGVGAEVGSGNLIESNGACTVGPVVTTDPNLGVLTLNAPGLTPTMAILSSSAAFDGGDDATCLPDDQRGVARPQFVRCDIGAYELAPLEPADLALAKSAVSVVDPDGAGPLAPVALPIVGPGVPPGSVNAGGYIRFDLPFGNAGTGDAGNVMITDPIPGNTAFVGALATGAVFVPAAQPPAVPFTFTIQATRAASPAINLTCTVAQAPGSQTIYCRPQGNAPVSDGVLPAGYNGTLTFFVKVNESVAGGTIVSNPANITSGLCPNGAGPVPPPFPPVVCPSTPDPNVSNNNSLQTQTVVVASSNLTVSKIVQSAVTSASNPNQTGPIGPATPPNGAGVTGTPVLPGTYMTYRVIVTNNGPSDVSNIRLTDVLPSGLETPPGRVLGVKYISINPVIPSGATFTCAPPTGVNPANNPQLNGGSVVCTAPLLSANAPNNVAAIDVTVFIDPATRASMVNSATVDATLNNFNRPISGTAVLTTPVAPNSDLAVTKTHIDATGIPGGPILTPNYYIITATNNGPSSASSFSLTDTFPAFQKVTQIEIGRINDSNVFVTPNAKDGNGNPTVSCGTVPALGSPGNTTSMTCTAQSLPPNKNPDGTVNPAGTVVFRLSVVQDPFTPPGPQTNCVSATSASTDPIPANNTGVCDNTVQFFFVPLAFDDHYFTLKDTVLDVPPPGVLGNDKGYLPPTAVPINNGLTQQGGHVTLNADGSFTYTPPPGFSGTDGFDYTAINNIGSDMGHVELTVTDPATIALRISEFRFNGPNGSTDEFFEIYNASPTDHLVGTTAGSNDGGYGLFASAGNGVTSNTVTLICMIPNGTVIPARGYVLCTGAGYSMAALGAIGSSTGSAISPAITGAAPTAVGNFPIINGTPGKPGVYSSVDVPNDAGLLLANVGDNTVGASANIPDNGDFGFEATGVSPANFTVYDRVGFAAYGSGAPLQACQLANPASCGLGGNARPSLADQYCETSAAQCLRPVADASTTNHGAFVFYGDSGQYSLLRRQTTDQSATIGTVPQDTANNADDFVMVSPVPGVNIAFNITNFPTGLTPGLVSVLGAAGPQNNAAPADLPETRLQSSLFDLTKTSTQLPNAERRYVIDTANTIINNNPMGSFIFRFGFRNTSASTAINRLRFRIDNLTVPCGQVAPAPAAAVPGSGNARNLHQTSPNCQGTDAKTAVLKMLNMPTELVAPENGPVQTVRGSVIEDTDGTKLAPNGGGVNNSLVRTGTTQGSLTGEFTTVVPAGSPGPKFYIGFRMGVVKGGSFRFLFQPEGSSTAPVPLPTVP